MHPLTLCAIFLILNACSHLSLPIQTQYHITYLPYSISYKTIPKCEVHLLEFTPFKNQFKSLCFQEGLLNYHSLHWFIFFFFFSVFLPACLRASIPPSPPSKVVFSLLYTSILHSQYLVITGLNFVLFISWFVSQYFSFMYIT